MANLTQCIKAGSNTGQPGYLIRFGYDANLVERKEGENGHDGM